MALAAPPTRKWLTMAEVLERVGDIPLDRILKRPRPGTATEQDVLDLDDHEDILCELIDGILVKKPVGYLESRIAATLIRKLDEYLESSGLGVLAGEAGMLR